MTATLDLFAEVQEVGAARPQLPVFPTTRYQGSKRKIADPLAEAFSRLDFRSALDLFSGSGTVTLLLRHLGKTVDANDYLIFNQNIAELFLSATTEKIRSLTPTSTLRDLLNHRGSTCGDLVERHYDGIFFLPEENRQIDQFCDNLRNAEPFERLVYVYAVGQALMKKRPYNLFHRANLSMRLSEVKRSFGNAATWEKSIEHHAVKAVQELMAFPFGDSPNEGRAFSRHTSELACLPDSYDLIYIDPPYLNSKELETNYSNFYGFLNGLCDYSLWATGDDSYAHRPLLLPDSGWRSERGAIEQLEATVRRWPQAVLFVSYRSDGRPSGAAIKEALSSGGRRAEVHSFGEFKYALSRTDTNEELYVVSFP
jgi:adenine-specific DNA-methyltransferase